LLRRTKIVATIGPATDDPKLMTRLLAAGVDVVRLNFSHGSHDTHIGRANMVLECAKKAGREVGILVDLQGPKIRTGKFKNGKGTLLEEGKRFVLDGELSLDAGTDETVGITYKELPRDVVPGAVLLLDDGRLALRVDEVSGEKVICTVVTGGELKNNKGINRQGGGLTAPALTEKDKEDILVAAKIGADYLAISFPRSAADVELARSLLRKAGGKGGIVAKIERAEAVAAIEEIIQASDAVMVARGDLAVEIGDAAVPPVQKRMIKLARQMNRVVITATQMMESMIESPVPTRAEVSDVANAVLDGTDAVMLSAESASGKYPVEAVQAMDRVCRVAEQQYEATHANLPEADFKRVDEAIAMAVMHVGNHLPVRAIAALTESGSTTLWMSRVGSALPIYALTAHEETRRRVTLYRGVYPVSFSLRANDPSVVLRHAVSELRRRGAIQGDDLVIVTVGEHLSTAGGTNTMKIICASDVRDE
jgi:pyruvate kinase